MGKLKGIFIFCFIAFNLVSLKGLAQQDEREYMIEKMLKIADPVLNNLAEEKLKKNMPVERSPGAWDDRTHVTYLEAFGRLYSGMAPRLELEPDDTPEGKLR